MRLTPAFSVSPATIIALTLLRVAAAQPFEHIQGDGCAVDSVKVTQKIICGETNAVLDCVEHHGSKAASLQECLEEAGCTADEARTEMIWVVERCSRAKTGAQEEALELRHVVARETTTESTSTETSTSSSSTSTSTESTTTTTSSSSSTATTTSSSSSSESTTASTTSSSTTSSTSSTASSTSTSTTSANTKGMTTVSYIVAVAMALFVAGCVGGICFSCYSESSARKKEARIAESKMGLLASH